MPPASRIPLVDFAGSAEPGAERDAVIGTIRRACEEIGLLVITGHGVPKGLSETPRMLPGSSSPFPRGRRSAAFRYRARGGASSPQGSALAMTHDVEAPPDLCETYSVSRFDEVRYLTPIE